MNVISQESTFAIGTMLVEGNVISAYNSQPAVHQPIWILHTKNGCLLIQAVLRISSVRKNNRKFHHHPLPPHLTTHSNSITEMMSIGAPNSTTAIITPSLTILQPQWFCLSLKGGTIYISGPSVEQMLKSQKGKMDVMMCIYIYMFVVLGYCSKRGVECCISYYVGIMKICGCNLVQGCIVEDQCEFLRHPDFL